MYTYRQGSDYIENRDLSGNATPNIGGNTNKLLFPRHVATRNFNIERRTQCIAICDGIITTKENPSSPNKTV